MIIKAIVSEELKEEITEYAQAVDRSVSSLLVHAVKCYMKMHPNGSRHLQGHEGVLP